MPDNNESVFPKKYAKRLPQEFVDATDQSDTEEIKKRILECEGHLASIEKARGEDEGLLKAREHAKELAAQYKEPKNVEVAKIAYAIYVLESRGVSLSRE